MSISRATHFYGPDLFPPFASDKVPPETRGGCVEGERVGLRLRFVSYFLYISSFLDRFLLVALSCVRLTSA